jgi:hypothetical protein
MGLDSYVRRVVYVRDKDVVSQIAEVIDVPDGSMDDFGSAVVHMPFLYWRKDWAFHQWFADHVYDGQDIETDAEFGAEDLQRFHDDLYTALTYPDTDDQLFDPNYWSDEETAPDRFANRRETLAIVAEELKRVRALEADKTRPHYYALYEYHGSW